MSAGEQQAVGRSNFGHDNRTCENVERSIYIVMGGTMDAGMEVSRKAVLIVLFVPSVERDGVTAIDQDYWVSEALETFGQLFGGVTAFPKARGV
jgi:hypothetical protein